MSELTTIGCPFAGMDISADDCVYMDKEGKCQDVQICPGNSDAWCTEKIEAQLAYMESLAASINS